MSNLGGREDELIQAAFTGRVFYDTDADLNYTVDGEPADADTASRLDTLIADGYLARFREPDTVYPQPSFFTAVVTTPAAWAVMDS